jgi:hypothetical protein
MVQGILAFGHCEFSFTRREDGSSVLWLEWLLSSFMLGPTHLLLLQLL